MAVIKVEALEKVYDGVKAVNNISFEVNEGENLILLGTSGCGKTTTLKMLNSLIEPSAGTIWINGKNIKELQPEELRINMGYVLQNIGLFPHYTIYENIAVVPRLLKWDEGKTKARIDELISKLHLSPDVLNNYPAQLSGGQQQRVGLARALAANPAVLLMDEPFGALDNITRASIQQEFKELDELKRKTIVMVTHDVQEAFELGNRICLMDKGEIMQIGSPTELLFKPANTFVSDFLHGQRLQLEFKAITLIDLWDALPDTFVAATTTLPATTNVWQAIAQLKASQTLNVQHPEKQQIKSVNIEQLMNSFSQYQNHKPA